MNAMAMKRALLHLKPIQVHEYLLLILDITKVTEPHKNKQNYGRKHALVSKQL